MRLLSRPAVDELDTGLPQKKRQADPNEVPIKAQKLLGEKPRLLYNEKVVVRSHDHTQVESMAIPPKAQKLLGEKRRVKKSQDIKHSDPDSLWNVRDAEQKTLGSFAKSEADSDTIPGAKQGLPLPFVPVPMRPSDDFSTGSTAVTGTSTNYPAHQISMESMNREYYDASKQPLYVSQQTSESSVRDMALHRGAVPISDTSSETHLLARPSVSSSTDRRTGKNSRTVSDEPKRPRKVDLSPLLAQAKTTSAGLLSSAKFTRTPAAKTDFDFFPKETVHVSVARRGSKRGLETDAKPLPKQPMERSKTTRAKVFDSDVYDSKKVHVHRPPKGVKNWFDGLDISSDEEEAEQEPQPEPEPSSFAPIELPANEVPRIREALPSVFSPYGTPMREFPAPYHDRSESGAEDGILPSRTSIEARRRIMMAKNSQGSDVIGASPPQSRGMEDHRQGGDSRLAHSRLGSHSVLSLSSESGGDENLLPKARARASTADSEAVAFENASSLEMQRPAIPPRRLESLPNHEGQVSRVDSARQQQKPTQEKLIDVDTPPRVVSRGNTSVLSDSSATARKKLSGVQGSPAQSSPRRTLTGSSQERDGAKSAGSEAQSPQPSDASRMMAVTEEEMMLLGLMRQKRAAMARDSFSEGYRVALQGEPRYSFQSGGATESVHDQAIMSLGKRDRGSMRSRKSSRAENLIKDEMEHRRRLSDMRKEEVDKSFKMGRFLSMEAPIGDGSGGSRIERFLVMAPGLAGEFGGRPVSGTDFDIESQCEEERGEQDLLTGADEEKEEIEMIEMAGVREDEQPGDNREDLPEMETPTQTTQTFSPMQRLTNQVRGLSTEDAPSHAGLERDDYEDVADYLDSTHDMEEDIDGDIPALPSQHDNFSHSKETDTGELLSPTVYTPKTFTRFPRKSLPPSLDPIQIDAEDLIIDHYPEFEVDSPDTPVATNWARTSSLKHPRPQRQQAVMDFTPLESEQREMGQQPASPSVATTRSSGVTSTCVSISTVSPPAQILVDSADVADDSGTGVNDTDDSEADSYATALPPPLPQMPLHPLKANPVTPTGPPEDNGLSTSSALPSLDTALSSPGAFKQQPQGGRITSMASITSAGEDVLAAWAELGGSENLAFHKRKRART